ncbi:putative coatomer subunit beta'-3 isoform X1 [Arachis hypogaea]|uniref:putative coatomer subunit beta'-3 isoform X1 n=2 Tax=Arachis hypogaea TaxID=3818 RepID=UPI003B228DC1
MSKCILEEVELERCFATIPMQLMLGRLEVVKSIAIEMQSESKWKQMRELAMSNGRLDMAEDCLNHVMDLSELLPLYSSLEEAEGISKFVFLASCRKN